MRVRFGRVFENKLFTYLLLLIITIPTFFHVLKNAYFPIHDDQSVARLYLLDQGIRLGVLYPRWTDALGFGFGYPLFNFYPPLVYYVGEFFHIFGASYIWSIKLVMITGFVLGAFGMYVLAGKYISKRGALLASVLYTYFTYHAVVACVRGALAEFFTFAVLPPLFAALLTLVKAPSYKTGAVFGLLLAALILTHPLIAFPTLFYIGFFLLFHILITKNKWEIIRFSLIGLMAGLALSSFFWLPSLAEKKYTLTDAILTRELASYKIHFVYPFQFYYSQWGYGGSIEGPFDGVSFQLGKIHIALALLSLVLAFLYLIKKKKIDEKLMRYIFVCFLLAFSLFMATYFSSFLWDALSFLWFLQFPWRFLTFAGVFIAVAGGYSLEFMSELMKRQNIKNILVSGLAIVSCALAIVTYQKYFKPQSYLAVTDGEKTSYKKIAWDVSRSSFEFIPKGVKTKKSRFNTTIPDIDEKDIPKSPYKLIKGQAHVQVIKNTFSVKEFRVEAAKGSVLQLTTFNFPGWTAYMDAKQISITDNNKHKLITVVIPHGKHDLTIKFEDTPARRLGNTISIGVFLVIVLYPLKQRGLKKL